MASNLGNILALFIIIPLILFTGDLIGIQSMHNQLESLATQITFSIQKNGYITQELNFEIYQTYHAYLEYNKKEEQTFGEFVDFTIYKYYEGILWNDKDLIIKVNRSVLIGYFG